MNKKELIREVKKRMEKELPKPEWVRREVVESAVNAVFEVLKEKVLSGEEVRIREFGKFYLKQTAERNAVNPRTLERVKVPARKKFVFEASEKIKFVEE